MQQPETIFTTLNRELWLPADQTTFLEQWCRRMVGPLRPLPSRLMTLQAVVSDRGLSQITVAHELRRLRQEVIAICEAHGGEAYVLTYDTVVSHWSAEIPNWLRLHFTEQARRSLGKLICTKLILDVHIFDVRLNGGWRHSKSLRDLIYTKEHNDNSVAVSGCPPDLCADRKTDDDLETIDDLQLHGRGNKIASCGRLYEEPDEKLRDCVAMLVAPQAQQSVLYLDFFDSRLAKHSFEHAVSSISQQISPLGIHCIRLDWSKHTTDEFYGRPSAFDRHLAFELILLSAGCCTARPTAVPVEQRLIQIVGRRHGRNLLASMLGSHDRGALDQSAGAMAALPDASELRCSIVELLAVVAEAQRLVIAIDSSRDGPRRSQRNADWLIRAAEALPGVGLIVNARLARLGRLAAKNVEGHTVRVAMTKDGEFARAATETVPTDIVVAHSQMCRDALGDGFGPGQVELCDVDEHAGLIAALSIFELPFTVAMVARCLSAEQEQVAEALSKLVDVGILKRMPCETVRCYAFRNAGLRAAAGSRISPSAKAKLHGNFAVALGEDWHRGGRDTLQRAHQAGAVAHHFEQSAATVEAQAWWALAGDCFSAADQHSDAANAYARALATVRQTQVPDPATNTGRKALIFELEHRMRLVRSLHRLDPRSNRIAITHLRRCTRLAERLGTGRHPAEVEALAAVAEIMRERGNVRGSREAIDRLENLSGFADLPVAVIAASSRALLAGHRGNFVELVKIFEAGTLDVDDRPLPTHRASCAIAKTSYRCAGLARSQLGVVKTLQFDQVAATDELDRAVCDMERLGEATSLVRVLLNAAIAAFWAGQLSTVASMAIAANAMARRHNLLLMGPVATSLLAWCRVDQAGGRALDDLEHAAQRLADHQAHTQLVLVRYIQGLVLAKGNNLHCAAVAIRRAKGAAQATGFQAWTAELLRLEALIELRSGGKSPRQAAARLRKALARAKQQGAPLFINEIAKTVAEHELEAKI